MPRVIYCDITRCDNCRECVTACEREHYGCNHMFVQKIDESYVPVNCRHCDESPCVEVCPTGAMARISEDVVAIASMKCIGCQLCTIACPFGAVWFDALNKVSRKCDLCQSRLEHGLIPACVTACSPQHALQFGEFEEMLSTAHERGLQTVITRASGDHGTILSIPVNWNGKGV
ncbi:MAG: 4Fe-4S binding protein [Chloroflexi bacterium]|nr:4Fe-4S binding protein [Chloroflexota bacterium]